MVRDDYRGGRGQQGQGRERRDIENEELRRQVQQLTEKLERLETRSQKDDDSSSNDNVNPFHIRAPREVPCEEGKCGGAGQFVDRFSDLNVKVTHLFHFELENEYENSVEIDWTSPPIYDEYFDDEIWYENCVKVESNIDKQDSNLEVIHTSKKSGGIASNVKLGHFFSTEANKEDVKQLEVDALDPKIPKIFVDFLGVNIFLVQISKMLIDVVNRIKNGEQSFWLMKLIMMRKSFKSTLKKYSKYLFIWKGSVQLQTKDLRNEFKQWKIVLGFKTRVGDFVWIIFCKGRFPRGKFGKLQDRADGPFRVLKHLGQNAYQIELPGSMEVSTTFNVSDLQLYYEGDLEQQFDSRTSHFQPGENDEVSSMGTTSKDVSREKPLNDYSIAKQIMMNEY